MLKAKTAIGIILGISIALAQFIVFLPFWYLVFGSDGLELLVILGGTGGLIQFLLLLSMGLYPEMPLKKAIGLTLIIGLSILLLDTIWFVLALYNGWF